MAQSILGIAIPQKKLLLRHKKGSETAISLPLCTSWHLSSSSNITNKYWNRKVLSSVAIYCLVEALTLAILCYLASRTPVL